MTNRIKDALSPELYSYYKDNRSRYKKYASDLSVLQSKLFKDMVDNGEFPGYKKTYHYEVEEKCIKWMNERYGGKHTFDDFRKIFKDILRNYIFKSDEYYDKCENIICNYSDAQLAQITRKNREHDTAYLASEMLKPNENLVKRLNKVTYLCNPIDDEILDILKFDAVSILSFFAFGSIAYIFKHIIAFIIYILVYLCLLIMCLIDCILGILFNVDFGLPDFDIDKLGSPLRIWQIGGWISGFIVVCILLYSIYQIIEIKFGDKLDKWFQD